MSESVGYNADIKLTVHYAASVSLPVPSSIEASRTGFIVTVTNLAMDRDLVVDIVPLKPSEPRLLLTGPREGTRTGLLYFQPEFSRSELRTEVIVLLDRSGSMASHQRIWHAKESLLHLLGLLARYTGSVFNIVGFGTSHELLFPNARPVSPETISIALEHVRRLSADLGGTEMANPLASILATPPPRGFSRQIVLLTDGAVGGDEERRCLQMIQGDVNARVFTVGVGEACSEKFLQVLARLGRGRYWRAPEAWQLAGFTEELAAAVTQPSLSEVELDLYSNGSLVPTQLHQLRPFFGGQPWTTYFTCNATPVDSFVLAAKNGPESWRWEDAVTPDDCTAVYALVERLELEKLELRHQCEATAESRAALVAHSLRSGLLCSETAFLTIDGDVKEPPVASVQVPVPASVTGSVSWRRDDVQYRRQELFIDAEENWDLGVLGRTAQWHNWSGQIDMAAYLSGVPEVRVHLADPSLMMSPPETLMLHACIRLSKTAAYLSFIPPDLRFTLLSAEEPNRSPDGTGPVLSPVLTKSTCPGGFAYSLHLTVRGKELEELELDIELPACNDLTCEPRGRYRNNNVHIKAAVNRTIALTFQSRVSLPSLLVQLKAVRRKVSLLRIDAVRIYSRHSTNIPTWHRCLTRYRLAQTVTAIPVEV